jgi:CubicO group peptidase (beta-lactamase class C family)
MKKTQLLILTTLLSISFCSAQIKLAYNEKKEQSAAFSAKLFDEKLLASLKDSTVGFAYAVWQNGKPISEKSGGYKITPIDTEDKQGVPFQFNTRIHIASFSKTVTALAIAKLVEMRKIGWEDEVKNYLPASWVLHPSFQQLKLKDVVAMKCGLDQPLNQVSSHLDSLQIYMRNGPDSTKVGKFHYQNTSYGLLRVIIAYASGMKRYSVDFNAKALTLAISNQYKKFIQENIFVPAGINGAECHSQDTEPAMQYPFPYQNEPGEPTGDADLSAYAGGFGWYLSAEDVVRLMNAVVVKKKIVGPQVMDELAKLEFPIKIRNGNYGSYFLSGGDWGHPTKTGGWRGIHAYYFCFPENLVVTVFMNSGDSPPTKRVMRAYNSAFLKNPK